MSNLTTDKTNDFSDDVYLAAVNYVTPGLGRAHLRQLVEVMGSARAVFEADFDTLMAAQVYEAGPIAQFVASRKKTIPAHIAQYLKKYDLRLITYRSPEYPTLLKLIHDAPILLYVHGTLPQDIYPVAIVGSRHASKYGKQVAEYFAQGLARLGIPVISGGAIGIDSTAHEACLKAGGKTVAVIGSAFDNLYPYENVASRLFDRIVEQGGAVVTEYGPGMAPLPMNFPARNRIIVGLSGGVIVAQAAQKSGALITANIAVDEARDVFCAPNSIFERSSLGCHDLIRNGAKLVDEIKDVLEERNAFIEAQRYKTKQTTIFDYVSSDWEHDEVQVPISTKKIKEKQILKEEKHAKTTLGQRLLECMADGAKSVEQLTASTGESFASISMELLELQCDGLVDVDAAERYYRK